MSKFEEYLQNAMKKYGFKIKGYQETKKSNNSEDTHNRGEDNIAVAILREYQKSITTNDEDKDDIKNKKAQQIKKLREITNKDFSSAKEFMTVIFDHIENSKFATKFIHNNIDQVEPEDMIAVYIIVSNKRLSQLKPLFDIIFKDRDQLRKLKVPKGSSSKSSQKSSKEQKKEQKKETKQTEEKKNVDPITGKTPADIFESRLFYRRTIINEGLKDFDIKHPIDSLKKDAKETWDDAKKAIDNTKKAAKFIDKKAKDISLSKEQQLKLFVYFLTNTANVMNGKGETLGSNVDEFITNAKTFMENNKDDKNVIEKIAGDKAKYFNWFYKNFAKMSDAALQKIKEAILQSDTKLSKFLTKDNLKTDLVDAAIQYFSCFLDQGGDVRNQFIKTYVTYLKESKKKNDTYSNFLLSVDKYINAVKQNNATLLSDLIDKSEIIEQKYKKNNVIKYVLDKMSNLSIIKEVINKISSSSKAKDYILTVTDYITEKYDITFK